MQNAEPLENLADQFARFPGIGRKGAVRMAYEVMSMSNEQAKELAVQTFAGAAALAQASGEQPEVLRQQVTSKGGTTHAAISSMQGNKVHAHIIEAMQACYHRGLELGKEFA